MSGRLYTDVLIIGGGVIGSSICYYLSKKGIDTILVDREGIASGASGACDGFIFLQSKKDKSIINLTRESLKFFKSLADELSYDIEFENCGGLVIYTSEDDLGNNESQKNGSRIEKLNSSELAKREPFISSKVIEATLCQDEGHVNPINLNFGFVQAAKRNSAKILNHEEVISFDVGKISTSKVNSTTCKKEIKKIKTANGKEIIAYEVVCACGAWSRDLGSLLGVEIPIIPRKGNLIVTEALPEMINYVILDYDYLCCKYEENKELGFTIEQTKSGNILIGSTREFVGFNDNIDFDKLSKVIRRAIEIFPFLKEVDIIRTFCGFRPYSVDFLPILGKIPGFNNFWIAAGHEGDGIALSPITGLLMSTLIEEKINSGMVLENFKNVNLDKFSPERISKSRN